MDLIQGIGERYLMGKANAAPQMLENMAKKQFSSATDTKAQAAQASILPSSEKDDQIAKLRKELAETKLQKGKSSGDAKTAKSNATTSSAKSLRSEKSKASASTARLDGGSAKEMKGLTPLSIGAGGTKGLSKSKKSPESTASKGRSASISTATAAKAHKALSEAKGGGHSSKPGKASHGLEALGAEEALETKSSSGHQKAAPSASSSVHASSSSIRKPSISQHRKLGSDTRSRRHSVGKQSEIGSASGSISTVVAPRQPPAPFSSRRHSVGQQSQTGSSAATIAPRPPPPPPPAPIHHDSPERSPVYEVVTRQRTADEYGAEEPGLYVVEVEEDMPRVNKKSAVRRPGGDEGVVEVTSRNRRTVYKVT